MNQYIYTRVSTQNQDTSNQSSHLVVLYPNATLIEETASGGKRRPKLEDLTTKLIKGDELIVSSLDRLGRKTCEILTLIEDLENRGIILKSLREGIDYSTIAGRLVTQILVSVAEMEKSLISERTKQALAAKRKQGIVGGRPPKYTTKDKEQVLSLRRTGMPYRSISKETGISLSRVFQMVNEPIS
jgi:DNA invertase Pin-like site-specific DNA recombinase